MWLLKFLVLTLGAGTVVAGALLTVIPVDGGSSSGRGNRVGARAAPEFDPAAAGTVASLLAGGAVLLAGRRRRE